MCRMVICSRGRCCQKLVSALCFFDWARNGLCVLLGEVSSTPRRRSQTAILGYHEMTGVGVDRSRGRICPQQDCQTTKSFSMSAFRNQTDIFRLHEFLAL